MQVPVPNGRTVTGAFYKYIVLNKSSKLSPHTPVLPQVAMAKFNDKKQRAITHKLSKQELGFICIALSLDLSTPEIS